MKTQIARPEDSQLLFAPSISSPENRASGLPTVPLGSFDLKDYFLLIIVMVFSKKNYQVLICHLNFSQDNT